MTIGVVQDGKVFRVYEDDDRLGDADYLIETLVSPLRIKSNKDALDWFRQTLFERSLGDYVMHADKT